MCLFAVPRAGLNVMSSIVLVELFPARTRSSGAVQAYSLGVGPIAGTAPLVATALAAGSGAPRSAASASAGPGWISSVRSMLLPPAQDWMRWRLTSWRAMTFRWISLVPSPTIISGASRKYRSTSNSVE
jgi:hypothetical protein